MSSEANYWQKRQLNRRRFLAASGVVTGAAGITLAGCGGSTAKPNSTASTATGAASAPTAASTSAATVAAATAGQRKIDNNATLRVGIPADSANYDPQATAGIGNGSAMNIYPHFVGPFQTDPKTQDQLPRVAKWEWADDYGALLVTVLPGVKFHNGETLDAQQLKFNIDRFRGKGPTQGYNAGGSTTLASVADVTIVGDMTVKVTTKSLNVGLPLYVGGTPLLPMKYVLDSGDEKVSREPMGAGPFRFKSHTPDSELRSTRFDDFFYDKSATSGPHLPYVAELVQKVIPEDQARVAAMEAGEIDLTLNLNFDLVKSLQGRKGFQTMFMNAWQPMSVQPNTFLATDPVTGAPNPWRDLRVRQAANYAVDVDSMIKNLLTGKEPYSFGVPDDMFGFPKDIKRLYTFNPQKAKALLAEAGYPNGFDTKFYFTSGRWSGTDPVFQVVAESLKAVGIRPQTQIEPYNDYVVGIKSKTRPGLQFTGGGGLDPIRNLQGWYQSGGTVSQFSDKALDAKIDTAAGTTDTEARRKLIGEIVTSYYEQAAWIFLYGQVTPIVLNDRLQWDPYNKSDQIPEYWNIKVLA